MHPVTASQTETQSPSEPINPSTISSRFNAQTHGASAKELFIQGENPDEFLELLKNSFRYYKPTNLVEAELITDLTHARWMFNRRRRIHDEIEQKLHTANPSAENWTEADLNYLNRFDRYLTTAARAHQRALNNVRTMHRANLRTSQWKQLHELKKQKFAMQCERFEMAKAREKRAADKHEIRKNNAESKALAAIRSAKTAVPSAPETAPSVPQPPLTAGCSPAKLANLQKTTDLEASIH